MTDAGAPVRVLDIRDHGADMSFLDKLDKSSAHRQGLADRIVVVDHTDSLVDNHIRFQRLISVAHVRAVICVAVGPLAGGDRIALRQSSAFGSGVTLWVGDEWGSRWAGGSDRPRPITPDHARSLPDLIAALSSPQVFDEVFETVRKVPHQAVCPGLNVVHPTVAPDELRYLRTEALSELVEHSGAITAWPPEPVPARAADRVDPRRDMITPGSPLSDSRRDLRRALSEGMSAAAALPGLRALLTGRLRLDPSGIAAAADTHLDRVDDLFRQLDRQSTGQGGPDKLSRLGVPPTDPPDNGALSEKLRTLVRNGLRDGHSLQDLSTQLRRVSNLNVSEGSGAARAELASLRGQVSDALRAPAPPQVWPVPMASLIVALAVTTAAATWLAPVVAGAAIGVLWLALLGLFLLRLPCRTAPVRHGGDRLSVLATLLLVAGSVAGASRLPAAGASSTVAVLVTVGGALVALGSTWLAWSVTITGWLRRLRLAETSAALSRVESIVDEAVRDHVRWFEHRRRLTDAALLLASGATELARLYGDRVARDPAQDQATHGPSAGEVLTVLRADLIELTIRALDDYLHAIGTDAPLSTDSTRLAATANRDLTDYHGFLDAHSIHAQPPMIGDASARESLSLSLWQRSDAGRRVLRGDGRDELVQLCEAGDIRSLNVSWTDVRVLRFAPSLVQRVLLGTGAAADVITTETDMIGMLRLVPLAAGRVAYEHPVATGSDNSDGLLS